MEIYGHKTNGIILSFLHLGYASHLFEPFVKLDSGSSAYFRFIKPTLSPKDPNFQAWWEQHKSEWETPKKKDAPEGPEGH